MVRAHTIIRVQIWVPAPLDPHTQMRGLNPENVNWLIEFLSFIVIIVSSFLVSLRLMNEVSASNKEIGLGFARYLKDSFFLISGYFIEALR